MKTINLTPTWEAVMPIIFEVLENGNDEGKREIREELLRLAKEMDKLNERKVK